MSDSYFYASAGGVISKHQESERISGPKNESSAKQNVLKILVLILSSILVIEAVLYGIVVPCFSPAKISFTGMENINPEQLYYQLSPLYGISWIHFDSARATSLLAEMSAIENISIEKKFPDQVFITVSERTAVAVTLAEIDGVTVPIQIDKNGVLFSIGAEMTSSDIPLITGFSVDKPSDGMRLPSRERVILNQVQKIRQSRPEYLSVLSEIKILPKNYGSYDLMLYPVHSHTRVLTDRTLNEESLQYMMVVLDVIETMDQNVSEIDLRYGTVSYKYTSL